MTRGPVSLPTALFVSKPDEELSLMALSSDGDTVVVSAMRRLSSGRWEECWESIQREDVGDVAFELLRQLETSLRNAQAVWRPKPSDEESSAR